MITCSLPVHTIHQYQQVVLRHYPIGTSPFICICFLLSLSFMKPSPITKEKSVSAFFLYLSPRSPLKENGGYL